ncbi:MAG: PAS domain S-box protein [Pseudomonadota bacterium]
MTLKEPMTDMEYTPQEKSAESEELRTRLQRAERALEENRRNYGMLLDNLNVGVFLSNMEGVILQANSKMAHIAGYDGVDEFLAGHARGFCVNASDREDLVKDLLEEEILKNREVLSGRKDGTLCLVSLNAVLQRDGEGKAVGFLGIVEDISDRRKVEEALQESERKFRALSEATFEAILLSEGVIVIEQNLAAETMFGYPAEELVGKTGAILFVPEDRDRVLENVRSGYEEPYEAQALRKDGTTFPCEIRGKMIDYGDRRIRVAAIRDVSGRRLAEEALRQSEARYKDLFENAVDAIFTEDLRGNFISANKAAEHLMGAARERLLTLNVRDVVVEDDLPLALEQLRRKTEDGVDEAGPYELRIRTLDGARKWIEVRSRTIRKNGRPVAVHGVARDITERKHSDMVQRRSAIALEYAAEGVVITDPEGTMQYVNPALERMTGYAKDELLGKNPRILKSGEQDSTFYGQLWNTIRGGEIWTGRLVNRRKDGTLYTEDATISPVRDVSGAITNFVGMKRDITEQMELSKQLLHAQKMQAVGTLAGGIAHDFNNLLQAILGYSELLLLGKDKEDRDCRKIEVIQQAARDGADLVSRILTFSRKLESRTRPIDLNEQIRKAQRLLRRTVPRMIEIRLVLDEKPAVIDADPAQVEQVLLNLAVNAQHAMPNGGQILIETKHVSLNDEYVRTHLGIKPGLYVLLAVSDTGSGMEPEVMDRIFEPFFTTKINGQGTGLGLSTVHGIVSQHGGYIRCYSEPGRGTSFKIFFPVSSGELLPDKAAAREMPAMGTETILLVDDDERVRTMARQMIEVGGYKVITVHSGEEALDLYARSRKDIDLIILDLIMPGMGGKRCLEELLSIDPDAKVIVASGYPSNGLTRNERGRGAGGFVSKPYDSRDILSAIRKVLDTGYL